MTTIKSEIGFDAAKEWAVEDLYNFFHQTNILYNRLSVLEAIRVSRKKPKLKYALYGSLSRVSDEDQLIVKSIEISSPGDFNLLGVDKIILQLRELWKDISYRNRQEKESKHEKLRHQKAMDQVKEQMGRQELLSGQIKIMKTLGYDQEEIDIGIKALGDPLEQLASISEQKHVSLQPPIKA